MTAATQPFPLKPPALARTSYKPEDMVTADDTTPEHVKACEEMIAKTVCRHAVKANDPLRYLEVEKLITDLLECDLPYCCPHGRPTMIQISHAELEKKFGRKV